MTKSLIIIAALFATAACQPQAPPNEAIAQGNEVVGPELPENRNSTPPVGTTPVVPPSSQPMSPKADSPPQLPAIPDSDKTPAAAKKMVEAYFAALSERRYAEAYRMFPGSGMSASAFAASYAKYRTFKATVGMPGDTEGGAGSIYIEIPVAVTGILKDGGPFRMEGPVALRRVNDVDGATPAQLRWHIFSSALKPRP